MKIRQIGWMVALVIMLAGCDGLLAGRQVAVLPTRIPPTAGPSPTPLVTATPTLTATPSVTPTFTPSATPTSTVTPSATSTPTLLPGPVSLGYGEAFTGILSNIQPEIAVNFQARVDDVFAVVVQTDQALTLRVLNPAGDEVAASMDSRLPVMRSAEAGAYSVVLQGEPGEFSLGLELLVRGADLRATGNRLAYGDTQYGVITDERFGVRYTFEGQRDDVVTVDMAGLTDDLDAYLMLLDPAGELVVLNDDRLDGPVSLGTDARIERYLLPVDGTYTITAMRFLGEAGLTTGAFSVRLTLEGQGAALASLQNRVLHYGESLSGTISDETPVYRFSFEGSANDIVNVALSQTSGDLDAYLVLEDFYGFELAANDDALNANVATDARIENMRLPVTGVYTIVATRFQRELGTTQGAFDLTLEQVATTGGPIPIPRLAIRYGEQVVGSITDGTPRIQYVFSGRQGDSVVIDLQQDPAQGDLDAYLLLEDAQGQRLAFNDDAADGQAQTSTDARIAGFRLPVDGDYVIVATRFLEDEGETEGAFVLSLALE